MKTRKVSPKKRRMPLDQIALDFDRFQFRAVQVDPNHVDELKSAFRNGSDVPPIVVWRDPETDKVFVLDGHHRFTAMKELGRKEANVEVFDGSPEDARLQGLKENFKARLSMTKTEKMDAAWQLAQLTDSKGDWVYSKKCLRDHTGIADGSIGNMRRVYKKLVEMDEMDMPEAWYQALELSKGMTRKEFTEEDREAWIEAEEAKLEELIGMHFSMSLNKCSDAVFNFLARRLGDRHRDSFVDWMGYTTERVEEDDCDDDEFEKDDF